MPSLLRRLGDRKLVQWALAYLAGAWLVLQVMDVLGELFEWSLGIQRTIFPDEFVPPLHVGYAYLGLGEDDEALTWFERAVEERGGWNVWLPRYPEAAHLHGDPRFRRLVTRMGLTELLAAPGTGEGSATVVH